MAVDDYVGSKLAYSSQATLYLALLQSLFELSLASATRTRLFQFINLSNGYKCKTKSGLAVQIPKTFDDKRAEIKKKKSTARGIPRWSPSQVLTTPDRV